jgi:integrase
MPKVAKALEPLEIKRLTQPGYHSIGHVPGLLLQVAPSGARSWVLRVRVGNKRREIGLGAYPGVTLAGVKVKAQAERDKITKGIDPVFERALARQSILDQQAEQKAMQWTFRKCAEAFIKAKSLEWRSDKHGKQWENTLKTYAYPTIENLMVSQINIGHIIEIIEPHWGTKTETISRVRNRIEMVLDWASARKFRTGDNPARWKGNLDKLLANRGKVAPIVSHRSLEAAKVHDFMQALKAVQGSGARCLEFVVLTASRSGEARLALWSEIDLASKTWSIPGERMKSGRPHRVPLPDVAIALLKSLPTFEGEGLLFPGRNPEKPLSDMALNKCMRDMGVDAVPHGFRSTFSSWCASSTAYPTDVREMALAHAIGDKTVAAYQRSDLFDKRRDLMNDWARFIITKPPAMGGNVVSLFAAAS